MYTAFDNFLSEPDWNYVVSKTVNGKSWEFSGGSTVDTHKFWFMDLVNDSFFTKKMFHKVQTTCNLPNSELIRVYANGQTHGLNGSPHTDYDDEGYVTFLYYPCLYWKLEWGGCTVFFDKGVAHTRYPIPNSGILFKGNLLHFGMEPTGQCKELRVTVAFKIKTNEVL